MPHSELGWTEPRIPIGVDGLPTKEAIKGVLGNVIGYEMLKHDHEVTQTAEGVDQIVCSDEELARIEATVERAIRELVQIGAMNP